MRFSVPFVSLWFCPTYGVFVGFGFMPFIMGASFPGGAVFILAGFAIIRLISSGDGIPGVGVRPGLIPFFNFSGLGMPGVGVVPVGRGTAPLAEIPGAFAAGVTGWIDRPGGKFALSSVTPVVVLAFVFELRLAFELTGDMLPHPAKSMLNRTIEGIKALVI